MPAIRASDNAQDRSENSQRIQNEFPLSRRSLHDPRNNVGSPHTRASRLAQSVQSLARELSSAHRARAEPYPRTEVLRIRSRLRNLRAEPHSTQDLELSQLIRETDNTLESLNNSVSSPLPAALSVTRNIPHENLAPILPKTAYREQHEKEFDRSLEYVQVQCKILQHLDTHDTTISPRQAYKWTIDIVPRSQQPQPIQALRLCYYMRSLNFDVFADIKPSRDPKNNTDDTMLRLFVANRDSERRGLGHDHLYWVQRTGSNDVIPNAYKLQCLATSISEERPRLRLDIGAVLNSNTISEASGDRRNGVVQMRGGEAAEHPRYGLTKQELGEQRELQRQLRIQWVFDQAAQHLAAQHLAAQTVRFLAMHIDSEYKLIERLPELGLTRS